MIFNWFLLLFTTSTLSKLKLKKCLFIFLYGWIAGGWETHFCNYRHFVSQCAVSTLDLLPNFPHKAWVDPGEGSFTCQVNRRELWSNRSPWPLSHGALKWLKANFNLLQVEAREGFSKYSFDYCLSNTYTNFVLQNVIKINRTEKGLLSFQKKVSVYYNNLACLIFLNTLNKTGYVIFILFVYNLHILSRHL